MKSSKKAREATQGRLPTQKKKRRERVEVETVLDLKGHPYLYDHSLGGPVSQYDSELYGLPVMPFNMGLELMAQAAAQLFDGQVLVKIKQARSQSWLLLEKDKQPIRIVAKTQTAPGEVSVSLYKIAPDHQDQPVLALEAIMVFDASYPAVPHVDSVPQDEEACLLTREDIYPEHMFHGSCLQSIAKLQHCSEESARALLARPEADVVLPGDTSTFLTDPVMLDGAGQVVGLWAVQNLDEHFVVFPWAVEEVTFFHSVPHDHQFLTCRAEPQLQGNSNVVSRLVLFSGNDSLYVTVKGLQHRRIKMPEIMHRFRSSRDVLLSSAWELSVPDFLPSEQLTSGHLSVELVDLAGSDRDVLLAVIAHIILSRRELHGWYRMQVGDKRRKEWLLGRLVGKEAIRRLLHKMGQNDVWSADIEIIPDKHGKPEVHGQWLKENGWVSLSISHTDSEVAALAAVLPFRGAVGIDMEPLRTLDEGFIDYSFSAGEREIIASDQEKALRCWCAKEAAAKTLGLGMPGGPRDLLVTSCNEHTGIVTLQPSGSLAREEGEETCREINVVTGVVDNLVVATAGMTGKEE